MKGYILDSDTWIEYFHHRSGVGAHRPSTPSASPLAAEPSFQHLREPEMIRKNFQVLPIVNDWARDYAEIRHALTSKGIIIGDMDILIAVTARHHGLTLVTHNTKHFSKIPGIKCVDWVDR